MILIWVLVGGGVGSLLRFFIPHLCRIAGVTSMFPLATTIVNLVGCFAIGFLVPTLQTHERYETFLRPLIIIGFLGGFTTFSSFSFEMLDLVNKNLLSHAVVYFLSNCIGALLCVWLGFKLA